MADFSSNEINEAKKRVREMKNRAREFVELSPSEEGERHIKPEPEQENGLGNLISGIFSSNDSALILALVLILSHEKADNMLILALLYILL